MPKEIVQALGFKLKAIPNRAAVLLYPEGIPLEDVLKSLDIIRDDLEHAIQLQLKLSPRGENNECRSS